MPDEFSCISIDEYKFLISIGQVYQGYVMDDDGTLMFSAYNVLVCLPEFWDIDNPPLQAPLGEDTVETIGVCTLLVPDKKLVTPSVDEIRSKIYHTNADRSQTINFPDGRTVNLPAEPSGHVYISLLDKNYTDSVSSSRTMRVAIQTINDQTGEKQEYTEEVTISQLQQHYNMPVQYESYDYLTFLNNIASALDNGYSAWYSQVYKPTEYLYRPTQGAYKGDWRDVFKTDKMGNYRYKNRSRMPVSKNAAEKIQLTKNVRNLGKALKVGTGVFLLVVTFFDIKSAYDEEGYFGENTQREVAGAAGGIVGSILFCAGIGATVGSSVPIVGTVILGVVGGFAGAIFGKKAAIWLYNLFD